MAAKKPAQSFEAIAERLEKIAERLESGDAKLEESLELFAEGVQLAKVGTARLDEAERRIEQLMQGGQIADLDLTNAKGSAGS